MRVGSGRVTLCNRRIKITTAKPVFLELGIFQNKTITNLYDTEKDFGKK